MKLNELEPSTHVASVASIYSGLAFVQSLSVFTSVLVLHIPEFASHFNSTSHAALLANLEESLIE